ncbi:hypothetical protein GCM10010384_55440 [Streptomyces djakartensis]|uniref:Secreted protein n=1 Tax=Streptomyces djakartensis TaxID=68193 RepID=A0ABQ3ABV4_9ACTN|nr:hypothetical protein GCM10010384_55440 [Streptomyces djakartensis]
MVAGLVACLLSLPLVVLGLGHVGRAADAAVTTAVGPGAVETAGTASAEAEGAGEPCPCERDASVRQPVARAPRAAGASGASAVVAAAPGVDRGGAGTGAVRKGGRTGAVAASPDAVELQTFRC